ncbi:MAG: UDP-N-acetylmuramoyl-tripeptide--D-alanyl-D-alanine ligase [Candidatus Omnitrophica bacterium]|nr:UDP-N-acetylmuramoyl-tripeptide--D-alanyl-D-alanine ligase [Candidatus Omnitrophota bacterium]
MSAWTVRRVLEATGGRLLRGAIDQPVSGISIDSRCLLPGEAFVAIHGHRLDGHEFINEAVHRGASCLIVSRLPALTNGAGSLPTVLVDDTTAALGDLARDHRRRSRVPVIAVTGSCGKTTTKELIAHLLGGPDTVLRTVGTQNNHIGVPLTLLRIAPAHRVAVVELGSNHPGEIAYLASIVEPDAAVITNVGPVHLEFFGSLLGVLNEKLSLLDALPMDGSVVLPGDQLDICLEAPRRLKRGVRVVTFGTTDRCDLQALDIERSGEQMRVRLRDQITQWTVPLIGYHNVENTLTAIACVWAMGVPLSVTKERLASFQAVPLRSQVLRCNGLTILNDCYNANPLSFARALETLRDLEVRRKIAIVGDMLELGTYAPSAHQAIGRLASQLGIDAVMAVGEYADQVAHGVRETRPDGVTTYRTVQELLQQLPSVLQQGDGLLVKGSRKLNLEQVTDFLVQHYQRVQRELAR